MIDILAGGLSQSNSPTIENAGSISKVVLACPDSRLRLKAVQRFSKSISNYNEPSISVAKLMIKICGKDENCALQAIKAISIGISHYNEPTVSLAWVISEITKGAPTDRVKDLAMNTLSKCITSHTDPTRTCSAKLIEIGNLRQLELPVEPKVMPVETPLESPEKNSPAESKKIPSPEKLPYDD